MRNMWSILFWLFILAICGLTISGCLGLRNPVVGPPDPYDPIRQIGESVKGTNWLVTISILATALSVAALFNGSRMALGALVGSMTSLIVSLMVARYATLIAFIGLILAVGVLIYSVFIKNRALFEVVKTTEKIKSFLPPEVNNAIFRNEDSEANTVQSSFTKKIVSKVRIKHGLDYMVKDLQNVTDASIGDVVPVHNISNV